MRVHGNCAEYAPFGLLLMLMVELQQGPQIAVASIGLVLLVGRLVHAFGVGGEVETKGARTLGMGLTFAALGFAGAFGLALALM